MKCSTEKEKGRSWDDDIEVHDPICVQKNMIYVGRYYIATGRYSYYFLHFLSFYKENEKKVSIIKVHP